MHIQTLKFPIPNNTFIPKSCNQLYRFNNPQFFPPNSIKIGAISAKCSQVLVSKNCSNLIKDADVATLGNLCVDVVLNVPSLPPSSFEERRDYMDNLSASQPDKSSPCHKQTEEIECEIHSLVKLSNFLAEKFPSSLVYWVKYPFNFLH